MASFSPLMHQPPILGRTSERVVGTKRKNSLFIRPMMPCIIGILPAGVYVYAASNVNAFRRFAADWTNILLGAPRKESRQNN